MAAPAPLTLASGFTRRAVLVLLTLAAIEVGLTLAPDARAALALLALPPYLPPPARGVVVLDNVTFGYNPTSLP